MITWTQCHSDANGETYAALVPGGTLYKIVHRLYGAVAVTFAPHPPQHSQSVTPWWNYPVDSGGVSSCGPIA